MDGIAGFFDYPSEISECDNNGMISGNNGIGGITGLIAPIEEVTNSTVEKCYNKGTIKGNKNLGGIVGILGGAEGQGTVKECYNKGEIIGTQHIGEIMGGESSPSVLEANPKNTLNKLFYLINERNLTAVGNEQDDDSQGGKKIMGTTEDLTYEEFKTWITQQ